MALLYNPFMTLQWVAVPCSQSMPNVLNICEENYSSGVPGAKWNATDYMTNACPRHFLGSNNSCFTLSDTQDCNVCNGGKTHVCACTHADFQPQLLNIWGLSVRNNTLFIQDRRRVAMLVPKFQYWLQKMSAAYHRLDFSKRISFDIIPLSKHNNYLLRTGPISLNNCSIPLHFRCEFGDCILARYVCDGVAHCFKGTDEIACQTGGLTYQNRYINRRWRCNSGENIPVLKVCDFRMDCRDDSDETLCIHPICQQGQFRCDNGQCINLQDKCDLKNDCLDGTDEKSCPTDAMNAFKCNSGNFIPVHQVHDLWPDCENYEDETKSLTELNNWHSDIDPIPSICTSPNLLPCMLGTSVCYPAWGACLLDHDQFGVLRFCRNGGHLSNCTEMQCIGTFKCPGSYCLPIHKVCDSQNDCPGGADEVNCEGRVCSPGTLACANSTICVHQYQLCDNIRHCPLADDEEYCIKHKCPDRCTCEHGIVDCVSIRQFPTLSVYVRAAVIIGTAKPFQEDSEINGRYLLYLNITQIHIHHIEKRLFAGIPNIRNLTLSTGTVAILSNSFSMLVFLKQLRLDGNPIRKIEPGGLGGMIRLVSLNLSHTLITRFEANSFDGLLSLRQLIVTNTPLQFIAHNALQDLVSLELLDIRQTMVFVSKQTIAFLSKLPPQTAISSHNSFLCMIASEFKHSCKGIRHKPNDRLVPHFFTVILLLVSSLVAMACTVTSLVWHGRLLSVPYSLVAFHLSLSNVGTLTHSLIICVNFLYPDMRNGPLLVIYHWGQSWHCYLAMVMNDLAFIQSTLLFSLLSMKRCLAVVKPLHVYLLDSKQLKTFIVCLWVVSSVAPCLMLGVKLSAKHAQQNLSQTSVFCLIFTRVHEYWLINTIFYVRYPVLSIFAVLVMFISAAFITHKNVKARQLLGQNKHTTEKGMLVLVIKLFFEAGGVLVVLASTVLASSLHLDMNIDRLEVFTTEALIFAGNFRTFLVCTFHTFLASEFKSSVLACLSSANII